MTDLVERLRDDKLDGVLHGHCQRLQREAADEIERLRKIETAFREATEFAERAVAEAVAKMFGGGNA